MCKVHSLFGALFIVIILANSPLAAAELLVWTSQTRALALSDAQIAEVKARGVQGYMLGRGGFPFNAASLTKQEAKLKPFVERVHAQGMEVGLRLNLANYYNASTPLAPWFDDDADVGPGKAWIKWNHDYTDPINGEKRPGIITQLTLFAAMCRRLAIDEIIFDQEEYPGGHTKALGGQRFSWLWNYPADLAQAPNWMIPANTHTEAETRAKAKGRGRQMMQALLKAFPGVNVGVYYNRLAGTQWEWEFTHHHRKPNPYAEQGLMFDFWNGLTSVEGYGRVSHLEAGWYKAHAFWPDWDSGLKDRGQATRATYAKMHRADYLLPRLAIIPFWWPDKSRDAKEAASYAAYRGDNYVLEQGTACARRAEANRSHVYTHSYRDAAQHWDDDGIWRAMQAAAAITGPPIPAHAGPALRASDHPNDICGDQHNEGRLRHANANDTDRRRCARMEMSA